MASTGLFRLPLPILFLLGLVALNVLVVASSSNDLFASPAWVRSQLRKRSDEMMELSHNTNEIAFYATPERAQRQISPLLQGGITFYGPKSRLSNFHQTSGWTVSGCDTRMSKKQTVLVYCSSSNPTDDCGGVFLGGVKHTIIKLPEGCGASPFARIVKFKRTTKKLPSVQRKAAGNAEIFELTFDYNFRAIPYKKGDTPVKIEMGYTNLKNSSMSQNWGSLHRRGLFSHLNNEVAQSNNTIAIDHDFSASMTSLSQQCSGFTFSLDMKATGNINGSIDYGYYVSGAIIPPQIDQHYAYLRSNAYVTAKIDTAGMIMYTFNAFSVPILPSIGLPGLTYPGLLELGPYFKIDAGLTGDIAVQGNMTTLTGFSIPSVDISIGNSSNPVASNNPSNYANVQLNKDIQLSAGLTLAIQPQLGVQINVLSGSVDADVSLQPSAGIYAGGSINLNTTSGQTSNPCIELDGQLNLNWGVGGNVGPWGASVTGKIWSYQKKLYSQCFDSASNSTSNTRRSLDEENEWKPTVRSFIPTKRTTQLSSLICPSVNPFGSSSSSSGSP